MSRTTTLATIRRRARELADMEDTGSDNYVDDTELNGMINASLGLWHSMVATAVPERYEAEDDITATGAASYNLPADYYKTLAVEYVESDGDRRDLRRVSFRERNRFERSTSSTALGYRIVGSTIVLIPAPDSGSYKHVYVTHADVLSADGDTVDGVNGWEEWITFDVAIKLMLKEESDASHLIYERNRLTQEIQQAAADRNAGESRRVINVRRQRARYNVQGYHGFPGYDPDFWLNR